MPNGLFRVEVTPAAAGKMRKLDPQARRRIQAAIELLRDNPRPPSATQRLVILVIDAGPAHRSDQLELSSR